MAYTNPAAWYCSSYTNVSVVDLGTSTNTTGATLTLTSVTVPAGALICVLVTEAVSSSAGTLSDGGTNTYSIPTGASIALPSTEGYTMIFRAYNASALTNATLTYTKQTSGRTASMSAFYATGIQTSSDPTDSNVTATASRSSASPSVTSGTPSVQGELIVAGIGWYAASSLTFTQATSFTWGSPFDTVTTNAAAQQSGGKLINMGISPVTFAPTLSSATNDYGAIILGFKIATLPTTGYYNIPIWQANTSYSPGSLIRQNKIPVVGQERVFVSAPTSTNTSSQTSGATEPTWTVTKGAQNVDNTNITWQECTAQPGLNGDITNTPIWTASSTPALGLIIYDPTTLSLQICSTSGAGSGTKPSFSAVAGTVTTDSSAKWTSLGLASAFAAWSAPAARLQIPAATNWMAAGNSLFVADNHSETQPIAMSMAFPGGLNSLSNIYIVLIILLLCHQPVVILRQLHSLLPLVLPT